MKVAHRQSLDLDRRDIGAVLVEIGQVLDVCVEEFAIVSPAIQELILSDARRANDLAGRAIDARTTD